MKSLRFLCSHVRLFHFSAIVISLLLLLFSLTPGTAMAATCTSNATGNLWSSAAHWSNCGGLVPQNGDIVIIATATTVDTNTSSISSLTVNTGQTLTIGNDGTGRTVTVTGNVSVVGTGSIIAGATAATHSMSIGGNLSNAGTFDGLPGAGRIINVTFNGAANQTVSGAGGTTNFNLITINNTGAANNNIVEIASTNFTDTTAGFLTLTNGVLKMSGTYSFSNTFFPAAAYTIPATGGIWLNNPNVTVTAQAGSATLNGLLRITAGTYNVGTTNAEELIYGNGSSLTVEGGALNIAAALRPTTAATTAFTYAMSGGTLTVGIAGYANTTFTTFDIDDASSSFTMSGGTIVIQQMNTGSDYMNIAGIVNITGGTLQFGNASSPAGQTFGIGPLNPGGPANIFPTLNINSTGSPTVVLQATATAYGNVTINSGTTLTAISINGGSPSENLSLSGNWTMNGTFTSGTGTVTFNGASAQTIGGSSATTFNNLTINNAAGVALTASTTVTNALTISSGTFDQGSANNLTAGSVSISSGATFQNTGTGSITLNGGLTNNGTVIMDGNGVVCPGGTPVSPILITSAAAQAWSGSGAFQLDNVTLTNQTTALGIAVFGGTCGGGGCSNFNFQPCGNAPTAVKLRSFTATNYSGEVLIQWRTGHEINNLGFNLYREEGGKLYRLTPELVAGSALVAGPRISLQAGRPYTWWDDSLTSGQSQAVKYWLEDVDLNGKRTMYGPITPVIARGPVPIKDQSALLSRLATVQSEKSNTSSAIQVRISNTPSLGLIQPVSVGIAEPPQQAQWDIAGVTAIKLFVQEEGWYRLTQPELVAYGLDKVDPRNLQLYVNGQEVPMAVTGQQDGRFGPQDTIEFYGTGLDTPSTDTQTYWLILGTRPGKRVSQLSGGSGNQELPNFPYTLEARPRVLYAPALPMNLEGDRFYGPLISTVPTTVPLNIKHPDPAPSGKAMLEVTLRGIMDGHHKVTIMLNNNKVGQVVFDGQNQGSAKVEVTQAGLLREGENQVQLAAQGGDTDLSLIDVIRLTYWHTYTADDDALRFSANGGGRLSIGGFSTAHIRVMDITDPTMVSEVTGIVKPQSPPYAVTINVPGHGSKTLLAFTDGRIEHPAAVAGNNPSTWHSVNNKADMVIISHSDFIGTLGPLKKFRESQGWSVALIDVEDVYDEFSFGNKTPQALKDFLLRASSRWQKPPRFVLLVGDASVDPNNYLGYGHFDFTPTKLIETANNETASDDWFMDFNGDGLPEMAMGRIPVRTSAEATTVITKILGYEKQPKGTEWTKKALLVADIPDTFDFETATKEVGALLPKAITVKTIFASNFASDELANQELLNSINQGALLVNYMGHGSEVSWRGDLLTSTDAPTLTNGLSAPFFINMTCWNGWFPNPYHDTLAESLLKAGQGGAVAVWASSGLTEPEGQLVMDKQLISLLFNGKPLTLGEATAKAKAAITDMDIRRTWILFGDPATKLK